MMYIPLPFDDGVAVACPVLGLSGSDNKGPVHDGHLLSHGNLVAHDEVFRFFEGPVTGQDLFLRKDWSSVQGCPSGMSQQGRGCSAVGLCSEVLRARAVIHL